MKFPPVIMLWSTCVGHLNRNGWTWLNLVIGFPQPQRLFRSTSLWSRFWFYISKREYRDKSIFSSGSLLQVILVANPKNAVIRLCRPGEVRWRYITTWWLPWGVRDSERPRMWQLSIVSTIKYIPSLALPMSFFVRIKGCVNGLEGFRQMIGMVALLLFANS